MTLSVIIVFVCTLMAGLIAVASLIRESRSLANWSFALGMGLLALESVFTGFSLQASSLGQSVYWQKNRLFVMAVLPGIWLLFSLTYSRGNYREFLGKWKPILLLAFLVPPLLTCLWPGAMLDVFETEKGTPFLKLLSVGKIVTGVWLLGCVCVLMNLERTFMASVGTMRWRMKFMVIGLGLLFAFRIYSASQTLLFSSISLSLVTLNVLVLGLACVMLAIALIRARLSEIEIYPSLAVLQGSVTALLAGVYLLCMGLFAKVVAASGGDSHFPLQAFLVLLAIAGLGVLLLSDRLQQRARLFISRHFRRPHYDYRIVWSKFTDRTSALVDKTNFCRAVARYLSETFNSLSVNLWLVDEQQAQLTFAASTLLAENDAGQALSKHASTDRLIEGLRRNPYPVDLETSTEAWVTDLRQWNPDYFLKGSHRICMPLVSGGQLLGMIVLADRVSGVRFSTEDLDLLKCISDQVAASLHNIQLSEQITRAREFEAFQTMSTFVVHDLKNVAYTLSIMLQNMRQHFDNPEFRADAMANLGHSVDHINELITRFGMLRQGLAVNRVEANLNDIVTEASNGLETPSIRLIKDLQALPKLQMDPVQIQKVITNLIINARDAVGAEGEIRIQTRQQNGWAMLIVEDTGCGMSPEFIAKHLFKPFQSTKKKGLGIGMFHSKTIVEAHQGRIEVESQPQKGSQFRVLLPIQNQPS
jgi:putative PEP-CTERM system histidine kinase